ncbi:putative lipid II flippase FtsW [Candidatus Roizmanbacteria bacterium CG_4_9_14_0_2_um_filter_39_13]|uniref:Probable peptidoglycan glycosyltransferase FtsW n=1 Tax=Candidatus Roizmanbacteria bacterium CG_4_9_14_0_2_um_filter_39_13 TaxID=1974839 RepID=A0A2M8EWI5_9BACT|nr:MAG: putative lipid II flippase FtsW [Candidatus Roizmanbacteria bacterium CG_4_10_14_0_2_um_filter_39_12]PJC30236.1 MAG: putative lipid II flippase FtsW [Candidatus Roizmanbacteria bacterium CG_4_9_14_0_2_um_filter_39_13]
MRKKMQVRKQKADKKAFPTTVFLVSLAILFSLIGLIFVFEASSIRALQSTGDSFYFLKLQLRWIGLGIAAMVIFSMYNYKNLYYLSFPLMAVVIILLLIVLIPSVGQQVGGARRWINLGFITIQPTEFAKLAAIVYFSSWFSKKEKGRFMPFLMLTGFLMALILMQPDMGTAIIIFALSVIMYFLAGQQLQYLLALIPLSVSGFIALIFAAPYRLRRLTAFLNPSEDPLGVGFHINQILISLSEGGVTGRGFGASRQKYLFLPEAHTDSIFAIIGEELGFIGGILIIFFYVVLLFKLYEIYNATSDHFGKLLSGGIFAYFGLQVLINLGGMVNLMPLTGVTLPFLSYGGSSMITSFMLIGVVINIAHQSKLPKN